MKISPIKSDSNALAKKVRGLALRKNREKLGLFLIEGPHAFEAAWQAGVVLEDVLVCASFLEKSGNELSRLEDLEEIHVLEDSFLESLKTTAGPCPLIAVGQMRQFGWSDLTVAGQPCLVVADAIQDPGNLGTIMRSAHASCFTGLVLLKGTVDPYNPKVVRSAAGALFRMPFLQEVTASELTDKLRELEVPLVVCDASGDKNYFEADLAGSHALVFGNEGQGVSKEMAAAAVASVAIPMNPEAESLNVAVSAGIILFESYRQRLTGSSGLYLSRR